MLLRVIIILIIGGGALIFFGVRDFILLSDSTPEPQEIDLTVLENDRSLQTNHVRIGPHYALYPACIFEYETEESYSKDYTDSTSVNYVYYPIISQTHPFFIQLAALEAEYGDVDAIPDSLWPEIEDFSVLVKTTDFITVGSIPETWTYEEGVQGIVINKIKSLDHEEEELLKESFPAADLDNVLILDKGRKPGSLLSPLLMTGGGTALILFGLSIIIKEMKKRKKSTPGGTGTGV
ncbi:MAG: hypothetical protein JXB88_18410 [Spirochaetales bacterium]|nr:hypothetical protein [Spirochaetales bacterium]